MECSLRPHRRKLSSSLVEGRSALGLWQAPDHRRSDLPTQGLLLSGAPPGEDSSRAAGSLSGQGRGLHLRSTNQRFPWSPDAPPGRPLDLDHYTSVVLELRYGEVRRASTSTRLGE